MPPESGTRTPLRRRGPGLSGSRPVPGPGPGPFILSRRGQGARKADVVNALDRTVPDKIRAICLQYFRFAHTVTCIADQVSVA
jgi:hypothetical protein